MDLGISGRRALVLGGNRGIGFGIAQALAREGVDLAIAARDESRLAEAAQALRATGARIEAARIDLERVETLPAFAKDLSERFGTIDILVNNTGGPAYGGAANRSAKEWSDRFQDMVLSVITLTDCLLTEMRRRRWGRIITVVSSGVIQPIPILGISNTLRASLVTWSKTLSAEIASDGVTANILVPGRIDTERVRLTDEATGKQQGISLEEVRKRSIAAIPLGRYGRVEEVGATAAFMASAQASYMTGAIVRVDGGIVRSW
ncbi:MAG TPA: SDR family oxidoreductase [Xanthobacteraceae bacterium]|nr:SDR family oxidoreductase [Xanthobacteraceae bacterium]